MFSLLCAHSCQDLDTFVELQGLVGDMKQHQDRLLDTAAHLSNELSVNQEHVKVGGRAHRASNDRLILYKLLFHITL